MNNYLDITKSVIISSPAGSGKTEKLARRYISLLKNGVEVERILAITFTDKAAAEMKQRILRILKDEESELFSKLIERVSLMRVTTIHSFCGTLLRRFSFEAAIDPNYRIEEALNSRITWEEIIYEILMGSGSRKKDDDHTPILQTISEKGFRGLADLNKIINYLYEKRPFSMEAELICPLTVPPSLIEELKNWPGAGKAIEDYENVFKNSGRLAMSEKYFLTGVKEPKKRPPAGFKGIADYQGWALKMYLYWTGRKLEEHSQRAQRIKNIFMKCNETYRNKKRLRGILDFSDLEYLAYKLLLENPEWANILYAFDKKTDHILVDEFQDTNNFQWAIIDSLTEEWRSGLGAKREAGTKPTIFLVGDGKQSIYLFRGANVELFSRAKEKLNAWLGKEFYYEEVKENFRSLPAIINFTNHVFLKLMDAREDSPFWKTGYSPLTFARSAEGLEPSQSGKVDLLLLDDKEEPILQTKKSEAELIAKKIQCLINSHVIFDRKTKAKRICKYMDIAVLLRKRTHLKKYEEALRHYGIPFVAVKGIGFYQEPETAMLRALVYFLSNPKDDYSLYVLLKSPLFLLDETVIIKAMRAEGDCLFSKLITADETKGTGAFLQELLSQLPRLPVAELIETALSRTGAWKYFHEPQRRANIKKFIWMIEELEADGRSLIKLRDFLQHTYDKDDEPKANVNTEGMDAVKIMTIHASKGLEFPVVFVPGLEEEFKLKTAESLVYEKGGRLFFRYEPESAIRKQDADFTEHLEKELEEQKRLFYVAVTRAEDALFLTGRWNETGSRSFLMFLKQGLGLNRDKDSYQMHTQIEGLSILSEKDVETLYRKAPVTGIKGAYSKKYHLPSPETRFLPPSSEWRTVSKDVKIKRRHGKDWLTLGNLIHRLIEGVSKGLFTESEIRRIAKQLLMPDVILKEHQENLLSIIEGDMALLKQKGIWQEVIMPQKNSFAELPFVFEVSPNYIYSGRIDRIIVKNGCYNVYDYKTFPVKENEIDYLLKEYSFQLGIYKKAVENIFNAEKVKAFIVFTHIGEVREVL
ncbi:MAG: UvrD-helicase domain-containing protein [Nitrospirae bacterium]|nr:UvrD-helicase domain-containing protein [Nitrospirota bacterium]